jgi:lipopolysaccharide/colanic/teichoic acid biosynthesis glycosyltransferase
MKKYRLASQLRQPTKGGSLPGSQSRFLPWKSRLRSPSPLRDVANSPTGEELSPNGNGAGLDAKVSLFLRQEISHYLSGERSLEPESEGQATNAIPFAVVADCIPVEQRESFRSVGVEADDDAALPDTRLPRWKRIVDLGFLICTVWIWLPLTMLVMCMVKLVSPGPAFYRQQRVGFRGRSFMIFKFRSMHVNADTRSHEKYFEQLMQEDTPMTKLDAVDARLIPGGRFLRATGLDELPQIFNVIRGEMSLVGPRPCTLVEFERYRPEHRQRVNAPPGVTGYWQVNGKNRTTFNEMIAMDIFYSKNMSLALDLAIIGKTLPAILCQTLEGFAAARHTRSQAAFRCASVPCPQLEKSPRHS